MVQVVKFCTYYIIILIKKKEEGGSVSYLFYHHFNKERRGELITWLVFLSSLSVLISTFSPCERSTATLGSSFPGPPMHAGAHGFLCSLSEGRDGWRVSGQHLQKTLMNVGGAPLFLVLALGRQAPSEGGDLLPVPGHLMCSRPPLWLSFLLPKGLGASPLHLLAALSVE